MNGQNDIVARIDGLRKINGMSKTDLAKKSGLSRSTVKNWFYKATVPSLENIKNVCKAFNITVEQFFSGMGDKEIKRQEDEFLDEWRMLSNTEKVLIKSVMEEFKKSRS